MEFEGEEDDAHDSPSRCVEIGDGQMIIRTVDGTEEVVAIKRTKTKTRGRPLKGPARSL